MTKVLPSETGSGRDECDCICVIKWDTFMFVIFFKLLQLREEEEGYQQV
jgi:hypothetical protein